ncbi:MAG: hypothetical protein JXR10_06145 [Cyclobacteriaceae bacterium]
MKNYLSILAIALVAIACSPKAEKEEKIDLKAEVMKVHDEVMPKMGELREARMKLEAKASEMDSILSKEYTIAAERIAQANEGMMVWMRNFNPNPEGTQEEIDAYLEDQLKSIKQVKEDMLGSLEEGKKLVE